MENKFTLDEAFDLLYEEASELQLEEDVKSLLNETAEENQQQYFDSIDILQEAINLLELRVGATYDGALDNVTDNNTSSIVDNISHIKELINKFDANNPSNIMMRAKIDQANSSYQPVAQFASVERLQDMKFPQNIIFFITQFIKWIKNIILNFIDKFSNIIRSLLGLKAGKSKFTEDDLKLNLKKSKIIESKYAVNDNEVYTKMRRDSDTLNGTDTYSVRADLKPVSLYNIPFEDVKANYSTRLTEGAGLFSSVTSDDFENEGKSVKVIKLDTSKELIEIKQSLAHFFELFDNAYGSNDEKLFGTDDLEIVLELFNNTLKDINKPSESQFEIRGDLMGSEPLNAVKLKDNLLRTKINTDNLKAAYVVTNKQINALAQIIMNKNLLGMDSMGVQFAFLSASTYEVMLDVIKVIDARLKEAEKIEKKLQKMKNAYDKLMNVLEKRRTSINSVAGFAFTTALQRKINNLYDGARYMTQTVQLRMNTLALYINELNDTRAVMRNLSAIPESIVSKAGNFKDRSKFSLLKKLFAKG